jgi:exosome complex exonuclease RRP6
MIYVAITVQTLPSISHGRSPYSIVNFRPHPPRLSLSQKKPIMADSLPSEADTAFSTLQESIQKALIATTRATTSVCAQDIPFHRSLDPTISTHLDAQQKRVLALAERLLANAAAGSSIVHPQLKDAEAIDGNWRGIVEVVDVLLERADTCLDERSGLVKKRPVDQVDADATSQKTSKYKSSFSKVPRNLDITKPQETFEVKVNNNFDGKFRPLIKAKPHAKKPLPTKGEEQYDHPYRLEIESFVAYPPAVYTRQEPIQYKPLESTKAVYVDTEEAMLEMLEQLKQSTEIAIDLEHHDQRSYVGIVSLMQISTRTQDWIIDTLKPWRHKLSILNEVFANPDILKVSVQHSQPKLTR